MAAAKPLTDHAAIRRWAEARNATPSAVKSTASEDDPGILRLDFPAYSGEQSLYAISWDEWFEKFDHQGLALLVQEKTADGAKSNFNKIVKRDTLEKRDEEKKLHAKQREHRAHR